MLVALTIQRENRSRMGGGRKRAGEGSARRVRRTLPLPQPFLGSWFPPPITARPEERRDARRLLPGGTLERSALPTSFPMSELLRRDQRFASRRSSGSLGGQRIGRTPQPHREGSETEASARGRRTLARSDLVPCAAARSSPTRRLRDVSGCFSCGSRRHSNAAASIHERFTVTSNV